MGEDRAERRAGHRRGVDDDRLLVAAGLLGVALEREADVAAEVDVDRAIGELHAGLPRRLVEEHDRESGRDTGGERGDGEDRPDVGVGALMRDLGRRRQRIDEHRAAPLAGGQGHEEGGPGGGQHRRTSSHERPRERRAALQQRDPGRDQRGRVVVVEAPAAGGEGEGQGGERVIHRAAGRRRDGRRGAGAGRANLGASG